MSQEHLLVRAARGEVVERVPVWAMRQAGRWDPEFLRVRAGRPFFEFSFDSDASAEATLCPRRFGVDGIILFYDIVTLPYAMGLPFELKPLQGPVPDRPIRTLADLERLDPDPDPSSYQHIIDLVRKVKRSLNGELPVLFFAGAPFTVATYCIGTGKHMDQTRKFAADQPEVWKGLLHRLTGATVSFLNAIAAEGGAMYQLFDSWAGELTEAEYDQWAQPYHKEILAGANRVPRALFVKECPFTDKLCTSGADIVSIGAKNSLSGLQSQYPNLVFQGNVDEEILRDKTAHDVREATLSCLREGGGHRHILNLNHGMDRATPVENFQAFIDAAKGT